MEFETFYKAKTRQNKAKIREKAAGNDSNSLVFITEPPHSRHTSCRGSRCMDISVREVP